jgi:hypothetical protein
MPINVYSGELTDTQTCLFLRISAISNCQNVMSGQDKL